MIFIKFLAALLVLLPVSFAVPSPVEPVPRSTCTVWPTNLQYIYEASPNTVYPNDLNIFQVQQVYDPSKAAPNANGYFERMYMLASYRMPGGVTNSDDPKLYATFPTASSAVYNYTPDGSIPLLAVNALPVVFNTIPDPSNWNWYYIVDEDNDDGSLLGICEIVAGGPTLVGNVNMDDFGLDNVIGYQFKIWLPWEETAVADALLGDGAGFYVTYNC